jgi:F5/8 type C domain-containing protein
MQTLLGCRRALIVGGALAASGPVAAQSLVVDTAHVLNSFSPLRALGAGVDRLRPGRADQMLTSPLLDKILASGWQTITYRQNTELHIEAWHWNPQGAWSNPTRKEGYFTGSAALGEPIRHSFAYPLPHRGASRGDGNGWSRLTDGDLATYWKSNPYLTSRFTGEPDTLHPQWVMVDLGRKVPLDAVRLAWAHPYARRYLIQFWTGELEPFYGGTTNGTWQTFPRGTISGGQGGTVTHVLAARPIPVRYLRIWMTESSNSCDTHGAADRRNCVGYAMNEIYAGTMAPGGQLTDVIEHLPGRAQTITWPSSVDPWHASTDLDESKGDQVGFDLFFTSGVTRGLPTMVPVAMLYSTPDDAAAEIAYLGKRKYPISYIELGEEPDGQRMLPEDYGALYLQFASAIHKVAPRAKLGGPSFEGVIEDVEVWPDAEGRVSFLGRFLAYLQSHRRMKDFAFFSFEHYPFDACNNPWSDLYREPEIVEHILQAWRDDGLPANVPFFMTEGNMSSRSGQGFVDIMGGLWLADYVGSMMSGGASGTYFFHYIPGHLGAECGGGSFGFFEVDEQKRDVKSYFAQYFAAQLITREWVQPVDQPHQLYRVSSDVRDGAANKLVTSYAVARPDGLWSLLVINKDRDHDHTVKVSFAGGRAFSGNIDRVVFGAKEYRWHPDGRNGHPDPDGPPSRSTITADAATQYQLPRASIVVLRGSVR